MSIKNYIFQKVLDWSQKQINRQYAKKGATDKVINTQIKVNRLRHKLNLPETDGEFVQ